MVTFTQHEACASSFIMAARNTQLPRQPLSHSRDLFWNTLACATIQFVRMGQDQNKEREHFGERGWVKV